MKRRLLIPLALSLAIAGAVTLREGDAPEVVDTLRISPVVTAPARTDTVATAANEDAAWTSAPLPTNDGALIGVWNRANETHLIEAVLGQTKVDYPGTLNLPLGPGRNEIFNVASIQYPEEGEGVLLGSIDRIPGSSVVLSYVGDSLAGTVIMPVEQRAFDLKRGDDGTLRVTEIDLTRAPECPEVIKPNA